MHLRYRLALPMIALTLALAVAPAMAAKTGPVPVTVPDGIFPSDLNVTAPPCDLGEVGASAAFLWFFPSDDYYYTFFDPAACGCPEGVTSFVANWALFYPTPCEITAEVWVIPAIDAGGGCYVPDHAAAPPDPTSILCGPSGVVTLDGSAGGLVVHSVPLPACPCLANGAKAFVLFKIVGPGTCPVSGGTLDSPAIVVDGVPEPCVSYNGFLGGPPAEMPSSFGFPGNTTMWITPGVCCGITDALPNSWGRLKTLYR
jgi:hypothetical protein